MTAPADIVAVGETMALLTPASPGALESAEQLRLTIGGAESNVATHLARLGVHARWVGRIGDDPLGRRVVAELRSTGVDVVAETDPSARTGLYLKDPAPAGSSVHYYRDGSAASRMGPGLLDAPAVQDARILHLTGITAALSPSCRELLEAAIVERRVPGALVSFDVNHRPGLWAASEAGPVLAELADASDVVLVGQDEALTLWGTATPEAVRERLPSAGTIVVKDGGSEAVALDRDMVVRVPTPEVEVVEPVGAGDAFAAGYLAARLEDLDTTSALRWGHLVAARVLQVLGDETSLPDRSWFEHAASLSAAQWRGVDPLG